MPVPSSINDLATTAIANFPQGTESAKGTIDEYFRKHAAFIAELRDGGGTFLQVGTGAVARTPLAKMRDEYNILDYMTAAQIADASLAVPLLDHTTAVQAAFTAAAGKRLIGAPLNFRCTAAINVSGSFDGKGATFYFFGATVSPLFNQTAEGSLTGGFTLDGAGVTSCQYGLFVNTDFAQKDVCRYDFNIRNISNSNSAQSANGAVFFKASSASINLASHLDIRINVSNVTATANGVVGDSGGSAAGILVAFNGSGTSGNVVVRDSVIRSISSGGSDPSEDSNGIHLTTLDGTSTTAQGQFIIRDCTVFGARKRGIKIQAPNSVVERVTVYGQTTLAGFETYAYNTSFTDCRYLAGTGAAFSSTWTKTTLTRCYGETSTATQILNIFAGADDATVTDSEFKSTGTYATFSNGIVRMTGVSGCVFDNVRITGTTNSGSGFILTGANDMRGRLLTISGVEMGISFNASTGRVSFSNRCVITALTCGAYRIGNTSQIFEMIDGEITCSAAAGIAVFFDSSAGANLATTYLNNVRMASNGNGVLAAPGSRITNCQLTSINVTGQGISCGNSYIRGNTVTKYATGYNINFTTTAELADNVTIGTTTPVTTTGYTIFVNRNTDSRP